jgi:predicted alpha/beta hydrolase
LTATTEHIVAADGARIALHRLGNPAHTPVLLIPGTFSNSTFWLGTRGVGFARALADAGYHACVLDPRGHGASDRPRAQEKWDIDDWARLDVPAALCAIATPDRPAFLIGHSAGGAVMLAALSAQPDLHRYVRAIVAIGTPLPWLQPWRGLGARMIRALSTLLGRFPARLLKLGPEDELPGVMTQWMTWNIEGHWIGDDGTDYTAGLSAIRHPLLMFAGTHDRFFAPPRACAGLYDLIGSADKSFEVKTGLDHVTLVVSKEAKETIWPAIIQWLEAH